MNKHLVVVVRCVNIFYYFSATLKSSDAALLKVVSQLLNAASVDIRVMNMLHRKATSLDKKAATLPLKAALLDKKAAPVLFKAASLDKKAASPFVVALMIFSSLSFAHCQDLLPTRRDEAGIAATISRSCAYSSIGLLGFDLCLIVCLFLSFHY